MNDGSEEFFDVFYDLANSPIASVHENFGGWVPEVYDLMEGDFEDDIPLILDLAKKTGGPIADLGAGTGRLTLPLAEAGYDVFAIDTSQPMLARLSEKSGKDKRVSSRIKLIESDIRNFTLPEPAKLAVCSTNTFLYLGSLEDQRATLRNIHASLAPGGMVWIDIYIPKPNPTAEEPFLTSRLDPVTGQVLLYGVQSREDYFEGVSHVNAFTILLNPDSKPDLHVQSWRYAWLYPKEIRLLLETTGFEVVQLLGDYDGEPADEGSVQMIAIGRRTG